MSEWVASTLPGSFHPCEITHVGTRTAMVWQSSPLTAYGAWCWRVGGDVVHVTRGNRGSAKSAAWRALMAAAAQQFEVAYRIDGYESERRAGPYKTESEATSHADDIRGFVGVQYAIVVPARTKKKA